MGCSLKWEILEKCLSVQCREGLHQRKFEWSYFPLLLLSEPAVFSVEAVVSFGVTCKLLSPASFLSQYVLNVETIMLWLRYFFICLSRLMVEFRACNFSFVRLISHLLRLPVSPQGRTIDPPETVLQAAVKKRNMPIYHGVGDSLSPCVHAGTCVPCLK